MFDCLRLKRKKAQRKLSDTTFFLVGRDNEIEIKKGPEATEIDSAPANSIRVT